MTKYDLLLFGALFWNIYQLVFKGSKTGQSQIVLAIAFLAHLFFDGIRWQIVPAYIMLLTFFFLQTKLIDLQQFRWLRGLSYQSFCRCSYQLFLSRILKVIMR